MVGPTWRPFVDTRTKLILGIAGLAAAAALLFGLMKSVGVKSYGTPVGRVVRAGSHLAVLIETRNPYLPSLQGVPESRMSYAYDLWLIPETGGPQRSFRLARSVRSGDRRHNHGAQRFENGVLWYTIQDLQGFDLASESTVTTPAPASIVNIPISQLLPPSDNPLIPYRAQSVTLASGERLSLLSVEEAKTALAPGARLHDNPDAAGTFWPRTLHRISAQPGPIPRLAASAPVSTTEFRNAAFMRTAPNGPPVRFSNPEGYLMVHEAGDRVHPTVHLSRMNADGTIAWTADTRIGRLSDILPHDRLPAFVGQLPNQLTEPTLTVVNLESGQAVTTSLKGPLN